MNAQNSTPSTHPVRNLGPLFAGAAALLFALGVFALTGNVVLALVTSMPIGVALGIALNERADARPTDPVRRAWLAGATLIGVLVFIALYFFVA